MISTGSPESGRITTLPLRAMICFLSAGKICVSTFQKSQVSETMETLASIVRGHCNYYGVSGNFMGIQKYWKYMKYETYRMLNRRDQKGRLRYPKFLRIWSFYVPKPHITKDIWQWQLKTV